MTFEEALTFVKASGVVLESARGPAPSLATTAAGEEIHGNWWGHAKGNEIFLLTRAIRRSPDVLVCRLIGGKITYVHRRLWPALVRLSEELPAGRVVAIEEVHTARGNHEARETLLTEWMSSEILKTAGELSREDAVEQLGVKLERK